MVKMLKLCTTISSIISTTKSRLEPSQEVRNEKNDILVIKVNMFASAKDTLENIRKNVLMQKQTGVVVLPAYCEPVIVPCGCRNPNRRKGGAEMKKDSYISLKDIEPDMADEVKHKTDDMAGVVIAKYPGGENSEKLLDVHWGEREDILRHPC